MSLYFDAGGNDFDNKFEPETNGNGAQDPKIIGQNGQPLRYAARSLGGDAGATGYYRTDGGGDLSTLWAARGSVAYLVNPPNYGQSVGSATSSVTWGDRMYSDLSLHLNGNGTWSISQTTTNYVVDNTPLYNRNYGGPNYSGGRTLLAGNWAQNPGGGIGSGYQVESGAAAFDWGWVNYPYVPSPPNGAIYNVGQWRGPGTIQQNGIAGLGTFGLDNGWSITGIIQAQGSNDNSKYKDANTGLSWFNRGTVSVTIRSRANGNIAVNAQFHFLNELRWGPTTYPTISNGGSSGGGSGGSGGGGGCVAISSVMFGGFTAENAEVGQDLLVTDPYATSANSHYSQISYSEPVTQPLVRIETEGGAVLLCSGSAPIPTKDNGLVNAPFLRKQYIPVATADQIHEGISTFAWQKVIKVDMMGPGKVQFITVGDQCFWASADGELFILHHNKQNQADPGGAGS